MPINVDVLTRLDERSARVAAEQLEQQFTRAGQDAGSAFSTAVGRHLPAGVTGHAQKAGRDAGSAFASELEGGLRSAISGAASQFGALGSIADSALSKIPIAASAAGLGIGAIAVGAVAAGKALYDLGAQFDDIADSITYRTGKVGGELKALTDAVGDVGRNTAASLGSIGDIVGQISQSMPDLASNNAAVRQMASNLAYLDATGRSVDIRELGMAFRVFGVSVDDQVAALDDLKNASQATGIPINELIQMVRSGAPQFKQFGLELTESTALLAQFNRAGVSPEIAVTGLRIALKNLAGDSRGSADALAATVTEIKALYDAGQVGAAQRLAQDTFGTKNAAAFFDVIRSGTLDVAGLNRMLEQTGQSIEDEKKATEDWHESWKKITNTISLELKPAADSLFGGINWMLDAVVSNTKAWAGELQKVKDLLPDLPNPFGGPPLIPGTPVAAPPGAVQPGGGPNAQRQRQGLPPIGPGVGSSADTPLGPIPRQIWGGQSPDSTGGSGPRLPAAPAVPYDTTLPPGLSTLPQTSAVISAENSWLDARQALAEKQARLTQLEQSGVATADDITKAKNDVIQAQQAQQQAEMRVNDAARGVYDKQTKQLEKYSADLGQIGAQLDSDFGISKGLAGIVENITKFIANLAAAPVIGALQGGQIGLGFKPGEAGSGLAGILAGSGAFGPHYVAQPSLFAGQEQAAPSAMGPAAFMPGGGNSNVNAMLALAQYASGRTDYAPASDLINGLADCSGSISDLYEVLTTGSSTPARRFTTTNFASDAQAAALGFLPGYMPGALNIGVNPYPGQSGHMAATLPNGVNFEGTGGTGGGAQYGGSAAGALDPQFRKRYYFPVGGGGGNSVAGSPGQGYPTPWNLDTPSNPGAPGAPDQGPNGPTLIGGLAPPQGSGKGGISMSGGIIGAALSGASSAAGLAASGAAMGMDGGMGGAAAAAAMQIGIQEINRAIQFGSQAAGIGAAGLMETFLPFGASELAQNNWLTKIVGGLVGAGVTLPNIAGGGKKTPEGLTPEQAAQFRNQQGPTPEDVAGDPNKARQGGVGGSAGAHVNTYNTTINTNRDTISGAAKDFEWNTATMNQAPGMG